MIPAVSQAERVYRIADSRDLTAKRHLRLGGTKVANRLVLRTIRRYADVHIGRETVMAQRKSTGNAEDHRGGGQPGDHRCRQQRGPGGAGPEIVAVGVACLDHAVAVESLTAGERIGAQKYVLAGGGMAATGMVAAQRLGARCALVSSVGDDWAGHLVYEELRREGINLEYLKFRQTGRTGISLCMSETSTARKLIIGLAGGNQRLTSADVDEGFWRMISRAKILHLDGFHAELGLKAGEYAREAGIPVHLDCTIGGATSDKFLAVSDIVFASQTFAEQRFGVDVTPRVLEWLLDLTPARYVGLTMGAKGSVALDRQTGKRYFQPAFEIQVFDTVGAGDSYHGAMSFALARGWPMDKAMRLATAVGATCCLGLGGREGLPTMRQVQAFIKKARPMGTGRQRRRGC